MLAVSGPIARAVGDAIGAGSRGRDNLEHRQVAGDPALVVVSVAILYYATPNVKQPKFRWISVGAVAGHRGRGSCASVAVRLLRRQLQQLQQDLRRAGRRDRVPALAVDHQPGAAVRRGAGRRAGARPRSCRAGIAAERELQLRPGTPGSATRGKPP